MQKKFNKEELVDLPYTPVGDTIGKFTVISRTITGKSRWAIQHELIFKHEDNFYKTHYSIGATENQDESPWQYMTEVACLRVFPTEKTITVYE